MRGQGKKEKKEKRSKKEKVKRGEKEKREKEEKGVKERKAPARFTASVASRAWRRREATRTRNEGNRESSSDD